VGNNFGIGRGASKHIDTACSQSSTTSAASSPGDITNATRILKLKRQIDNLATEKKLQSK
jgi:hypothetical protein